MRGRPRIDPNRTEKRCPICGEVKKREEFSKSSSTRDGMFSVCAECSEVECSVRVLRKKTDEELVGMLDRHHLLIRRIMSTLTTLSPRDTARREAKDRQSE